ncbi:small EDRK-rich factor 1 isoform X1 [Sturnira hondurensis]|uniref:small EDRK-rich factor 1 isoform X1 n=1 Tax=Sturnira hondurensis TaxID=192404 RepID=UPI00187942E4|nr:small EDRK-rich factor 1 isoform X1 [Sturnira hondurensis]
MNPLGSHRAGTPSSLGRERDTRLQYSLEGYLPQRCSSLHRKEHLPRGELACCGSTCTKCDLGVSFSTHTPQKPELTLEYWPMYTVYWHGMPGLKDLVEISENLPARKT